MITTIRTCAAAIVMALVAATAAAQDTPLGLNLNGDWEIVDRGERLQSGMAIVRITHSGNMVDALFLYGAQCADGTDRPYAFLGAKLTGHPTLPPTWTLTAPDMWVCSGSPSIMKKCGKPGRYKSSFRNADVEPDKISGNRIRQSVDDCSVTDEAVASGGFTLRRLQPCELENRKYEDEGDSARFLWSRITHERAIITRAIEAAQQRYGEMFNGQLTSRLAAPMELVGGDFTEAYEFEAFFAAMPQTIQHPLWASARAMAEAMAASVPPLPEAAAMVGEMRRIEGFLPDARQQLTRLQEANRALDACLRKRP